ncbi:hypothetical protein [Umezawaea beigongshangensis]|uniref:hypothetical protein n=1 Tax=Umezawaea beigongshangensis TaxID=2780383 RepID=UPI0018F13E36|nr:hypothetical protein [Umezawaea beigongshangensis]
MTGRLDPPRPGDDVLLACAPHTVDPVEDSDGLRKFNIGLVPASVTPPRTWKRAAWFSVLSATSALVGLAVATSLLVGSRSSTDQIGLPGYPSTPPRPTGPVTDEFEVDAAIGERLPSTTRTARRAGGQHAGGQHASGHTDRVPARNRAATPDVAPGRVVPGASPPAVTAPAADGGAMVARTGTFFSEIATNADTALALATDSFRTSTEALVQQRYADVAHVEVQQITADPARGVTVTVLRVTREDGSTTTETHELTFTLGDDPLIDGERPASGDQR